MLVIWPAGSMGSRYFINLIILTLVGDNTSKSLFSFPWVGGSDAHGHVDVDKAVSSR